VKTEIAKAVSEYTAYAKRNARQISILKIEDGNAIFKSIIATVMIAAGVRISTAPEARWEKKSFFLENGIPCMHDTEFTLSR
jgi:hypothetical protein